MVQPPANRQPFRSPREEEREGIQPTAQSTGRDIVPAPRVSEFQTPREMERRVEIPDAQIGSITTSGTPYQKWQFHRDYVTDDERVRFTEEGIEKNYEQFIRIEKDKARRSGNPIDDEEALRRVMLRSVGTTVSPSTGDAYLRPTDVKNRLPANSDDIKDYIALNYPSITAAAIRSGLSEAEILLTANVMVARDAALEIESSYNPMRQSQIINTMGPDMQGLVFAMLDKIREQGSEQAEVVDEQSAGNWITDTGRKIWGYSAGPLLDSLWDANQFTVNRAVVSGAYAASDLLKEYVENPAGIFQPDRINRNLETWREIYSATTPDFLDPAGVQNAREIYGARTVDLIVEIMKLKLSGEDEVMGKLYKKYYDAGDIEALAVFDNLLSGVPSDPQVQDAATYLYSTQVGNLGNMMFWSVAQTMGISPLTQEGADFAQTGAYTITRDASNIAGAFFFDPTFQASKAAGAYRMARFGLHKIGPGKPIDDAFRDPQVRRAFDTFGAALTKVDDTKDITQKSQLMNTVNSQWGRWFSADGIQVMRKAGVRDADSAREFFRSAENIGIMVSGQMARRPNKVVIPHMTAATARVKLANMRLRGLTYDRNSGARLDALFDAPVSQMLPEEFIPFIIQKLGSKEGEKFLGIMLSDFVRGSETARRTFLGRIFDSMIKRDPSNPRLIRAASRYGFKRQPGVRPLVERTARPMARMPDLSALRIADGRDAYKIRELMLYGGMPKYWADQSALIWREMNPGQRLQFATGMGRSVGYARGIDIVDPVSGQRLIDNMTSGFRPGELFAPDQMDLVGLRGIAERLVDDALSGKTRVGTDPRISSLGAAAIRQELDALKSARSDLLKSGAPKTDETVVATTEKIKELDEILKKTKIAKRDERNELVKQTMEDLKANSPIFNPSKVADRGQEATRGLYEAQFADQISFINFEKLDELSMRQSYLSALLGTNPFMTNATDVWTLGTLAGPRFQVRNGIEDAIFYGVTGGSWKGYRYGQLLARARAEAGIRPEKVRRAELIEAGEAQVRGGKIGTLPTAMRFLGDALPNSLRGLVLPHLSADEIAAAAQAGAKGDRSVLGDLIQKAFLRQRLSFLGAKYKSKQKVKDLDDIYDSGYYWGTYDDATEAARHLIDGILPGSDNTMLINGQVVKTVTASKEFKTRVPYTSDPDGVRAWYNNLTMAIHGDGIKGTKSVALVRKYYLAKRSGDPQKVRDVVKEFSEWIEKNTPWVQERSGIVAAEGIESFAQRNLDDVLRMFTTKSGTFNRDLMRKIRRVEVDEATGAKTVTYRMWDRVDGKIVNRVDEKDLIEMRGRPQTVLDMDGIKIPVTEGVPLNTRLWTMMGRSYARMTRQPMFVANYLDARDLLRPLERRIASELGEEYAKKWAVEAATDRAYGVLMSYVDNPIIRSQMAFNLRNVARFYRALEDFNRRMVRLVKEYPEGIQKLNIAYRVADDTGWVHEDEFGEKSFIWPGSRETLQTINAITEKFGVPISPMGGLPLAFSSRLTDITPSADPDNWFPTFSGFYASASLKGIMRITPGLDSLEEELFGSYGVNVPVWQSILPTNLARPLGFIVASAAGSAENRALYSDGAFASANRTAIQAAAAAGWIDPNKDYTDNELKEIQTRIDGAALDFMSFRVLFGPVIPAAFSIQADTVSNFARGIGVTNLRKTFVELLKAYDGDFDAAAIAWMTANPDKSIFMVGTTGRAANIGDFKPFKETVDFIEANKSLVDEHPVGSAFFAPRLGAQHLSAYNYLRRMGAINSKSGDDYFKQIATSKGYALYRIYKKQYEDEVASGDEQRIAAAKVAWKNAREDLDSKFPLLDSRIRGRLKSNDISSPGDYNRDIMDYRGAIEWMEKNRSLDDRGWYAKQVLNMYDEAKLSLSDISDSDPNQRKHKTEIRQSWMRMVEDMKQRFQDDEMFDSLLFSTSGGLGFRLN